MIVKFKCKHILICNGKRHHEKLVDKKNVQGQRIVVRKKISIGVFDKGQQYL